MILLNHRWKIFSYHPEMRDSVDLERLLDDLFRAIQNRKTGTNSSIVDQDRRLTMVLADLSCSCSNLLGGRHIALIEIDPRSFVSSAKSLSVDLGKTYAAPASAGSNPR